MRTRADENKASPPRLARRVIRLIIIAQDSGPTKCSGMTSTQLGLNTDSEELSIHVRFDSLLTYELPNLSPTMPYRLMHYTVTIEYMSSLSIAWQC